MFSDEAKNRIRTELENGSRAREEGLEGRARVCARRAAGEAAREYFRQAHGKTAGSAHELLGALRGMNSLAPRTREAAEHLLSRVDENFNLGDGVDLLQEAQTLIGELERLVESIM